MAVGHWDVSAELRGAHGKWSKSGVLNRLAREATAGHAQRGELKEGHRVRYKTGSLGTVHHIDDKGTPHVVWDRGRGKPVATPPQHLTRVEGEEKKAATEEKTVREIAAPPMPRYIAHPKSLRISGASLGTEQDKKMRQAVLRASTIQAQHTPMLVDKTEVTITKSPHGIRGGSTLASHAGRANTLHVKPEVLVGSNTEAVRKANVGGWWVPTDAHHALSDNVLIHEFGHGVHALLTDKNLIKSTKMQPKTDLPVEHEFWQGFADALNKEEAKSSRFPNVVSKPEVASVPVTRPGPGGKGYETRIEDQMNVGQWLSLSATHKAISKQVSRYATTNQNEMMAELWTEYKLSSKPRAPAKYFGDWVTQQLAKAGGG